MTIAADPAAHAAPRNPSDREISQAEAAKQQAAKDVGRMSALISGIETKITALDNKVAFAKQLFDKALWDLQQAEAASKAATKAVSTAQKDVDAARTRLQTFLLNTFVQGQVDGAGLLTSEDPSDLLARGDLNAYTTARQLSGLGDLNRAKVAKSNADASARAAVTKQTVAKATATKALQAAQTAAKAAQSQRTALLAQKSQFQKKLDAAGMKLTGLKDQRAAYDKWHAEQVAKAKARAEAKRKALERALAQQQQQQQQQSPQNSGGNPFPRGSSAPRGFWTAAKGQAAVNAAMKWLGTPYAWAGGSYSGPTYGQCIDGVTSYYGDCRKVGFDCSGLTMYAWAQVGVYTSHYAPNQWSMGRFHPSPGQLMPGDLILYSTNGNPMYAHHITMYIGNGKMIEAPQSGSYVKISTLRLDEWAGAVRPGS